jgi:hypothetical protein
MFAHLTDAKRLLVRSNEARIQTRVGDHMSALRLGKTKVPRVVESDVRR